MRKVFKKEVMLTWHISSGLWKSRCKEKIRHARNVLVKEQEKAGRAPEHNAGLIPVGREGWSRKSLRLPALPRKVWPDQWRVLGPKLPTRGISYL